MLASAVHRRLATVVFVLAASRVHAQPASPPPDRAEHHVYELGRFTLESGATLPAAKVVYGTYGRLNDRRDNAILLPSHYMADHHGYDWLIGPDRALDPK